MLSTQNKKNTLPSERSTSLPYNKIEKSKQKACEYYFGKIYAKNTKRFEEFRTQYDLVDFDDLENFPYHCINRCPVYYTENCSCRACGDFHRASITFSSLSSTMCDLFSLSEQRKILDYEYCMCERENCDCFFPIERTQVLAFLNVRWEETTYRLRDFPVLSRLYRICLAIDNCNFHDSKQFYAALKSYIKKHDITIEVDFKKFMFDYYIEYIRLVEEADISYIPDLVMSQRPDLIAQIGEHVTASQSISDRIDSLINELSRLDAQAWFTVNHTHEMGDATASSLMSILKDLKDSVKDVLVTTFKFTMVAVAAILYVTLAYAVLSRLVVIRPRYMIAVHIILTLSIMYIEEQGGPGALVVWCKNKLMNTEGSIVAEDGFINSNILSFLPLFLINAMSIPTSIVNKFVTSKFLDSLGRKVSYLGDARFFNGISTITEWVKQGFETVKKHFCTWLGIEYVPDISQEQDAVTDWAIKCEKVVHEYNQREMLFSESTRSYVSGLYLEGCRYSRHPVYKSLATSILQNCRNLLVIIDKINIKLNVSGSLRNPPVTLMLYGDTGAGKSSLTLPLSVAILKEIYRREKNVSLLEQLKQNWQTLIYPRNSEQEFWDGYTGQKVCIFDDWNQLVDSTANPSMELFELIRASNVFPYPLHMAHLEDKSSVNFSSDVIICSSNNQLPRVESLNFPKALIRRFTKFVKVERKSATSAFDFSSYVITPYNEAGEMSDSISVEKFVDNVVNEYMHNKSFVTSINNFVAGSLLDFNPEDLVNGKPLESAPQSNVDTMSDISQFMINSVENNNTTELTLCPEKLLSLQCEGGLWNKEQKPDPDATTIATSTTWRAMYDKENSEFIVDAVQNLKDGYVIHNVRNKMSAFVNQYSWINCNTTYILGALGLIAAGLYLYRTIYPPSTSSAESVDKLDTIVRARKNARKSKSSEVTFIRNLNDKFVECSGPPVDLSNHYKIESYETRPTPKRVAETFSSDKTYFYFRDKDTDKWELWEYIGNESEAYEFKPKPARITEAYETIPKPKNITEACVDLVSTEMGGHLARSNLYRIYAEIDGGEISLGHVLFLVSNIAIMPKHFVMTLETKGNPIVYFANTSINRVFPVRFNDLVFKDYVNEYGDFKDLVSFRVPGARQHADIRNKFAPASTMNAVGSTRVALITLNCLSPNHNLIIDRKMGRGASCIKRIDTETYTLNSTHSQLKIHDAWEYSTLETQKGDCGAPLLATNERISPGKIIGIHVAGGIGTGVSTAIFYEDIQRIVHSYPEHKFAQLNTLEVKDAETPYPDCELLFLGKLERPVIQPSASKIVPSVVHSEIVEPTTAKTWLRPNYIDGALFDPLDYRTRRMGKPSVPIPVKLVDIAKKCVFKEFKRVYLKFEDTLVNRFKCPYSFEETCIGVDGEEFVNAVKRDTSCGFPFVQEGITRKDIFGSDDLYDLNTKGAKAIKELVDLYDVSALDGELFDHYFTDTLKDERKPKHKAHKTRMFAACPIDYLVWCKKWFNGVVAVISELRNKIHISVGTNVYSSDWNEMAEQLLRKSKHFVAGDFEGFDASQQAYLLESACWVLIQFSQFIFGKDLEAEKIMWAICDSLFHSYHVSGDNVFQWLKSLPSGHYLTAIINSIFVLLALVITFLMACEEQGIAPSEQQADAFFEDNDVVAYGDDHCIAIARKYISFYNQNTLVGLLLRLGLYYTDELKTGTTVPDFRSIEEISYLKRKFFYNEDIGKWVAPLDLNVILETPMWVRKCTDMRLQTFNNIEFSLRELSLHPVEVWNEWAPRLLELCETHCKLVSKFSNKNETMIFTLNTILCQSDDVIFNRDMQMQGQNSDYMLSIRKAVDIYPYLTGSAQAAPKNPVSLARLRREGALEAESNSPAEQPEISIFSGGQTTNEIRDNQYRDQQATDTTQQITTFENDSSIVNQDVPAPAPLGLKLRSMHTDDAQHSIVSFLKRPMILREFSWSSSLTRGKDVFDPINVPLDMLVRQFKDKLNGFMTFRATAVITVQFQTQPFQAGRFIMSAIPVPSLVGKRTKIIENRISNLTLLNHVQADIAKQTEVTLRVPYVSPLIAYDLVQGQFNWAKVVGKVYSRVSSVGTTDVEGIVYVHFEDIQLGAPTSMPILSNLVSLEAQSGDPTPTASTLPKKIPYEPEALTDIRQRAQEVGVTSSNTSRITGGLRTINKNIGEYLSFTKPVTNALDKYLLGPINDFLGPIFNVFGFSKPLIEGDNRLLRPSTLFSTFHGKDRALTLATSEDINAPFIPHLNGTGMDEMSFDYLKKIPHFIDYFYYSSVTPKNSIIYSAFVRPTYRCIEDLKITVGEATKILAQPTHLAYITQPFLYWTGSLVYTFKFVKTDYHSGRVEISYHPNSNPFSSSRKLKDSVDIDQAYRYICDLRDKSEVSLRIPYMGATPFKKNTHALSMPSDIDNTDVIFNCGAIVVRALTPLKSSSAVVSNSIEVLVEYNAGNDFQVMSPVTTHFNPITPLESAPKEAQSGEASVAGLAITRQQAIEGQDPPSITHNVGEVINSMSSFAVTGENFSNFRDLTHRTNFVLAFDKLSNHLEPINRLYNAPPCFTTTVVGSVFGGFLLNGRGNSSLGYVGSMFALARGGTNVRIQTEDKNQYISARLVSDVTTFSDCMYPRAIENSSIKGIAEFHVPYYSRTYQFDHLKYDNSLLNDISIEVAVPKQQTASGSVAVSGGDDISFGYFIGTPLVLTPSYLKNSGQVDPFDPSVTVAKVDKIVIWDYITVS